MKFFSKNELIAVVTILSFVLVFMVTNLSVAQRRARDAQRKADLGAISDALEKYKEEFGYFPPSKDGSILACKGETFEENINSVLSDEIFQRDEYLALLRVCNWGNDSFGDLTDPNHAPYLKTIPVDPKQNENIKYLYLSNMNRYQIYTYLEGGSDESGYSSNIVKRELNCGDKICSFGKSFGETPLDKSIEEYENELVEKLKNETQK